ncbi:acetyl-CoA carboxylase biotin carboxylase subunit [bacterium]|jgi:acetyl-CoA carboxylase biotin carboxylase subunit|nr:acetyl-CoA carboxylase biotin carboxylase subunit [Chlamydiota bacterium]NDD98796.1 acetyl-CoA carboxylase biotin carboxylase subunit [bacterium]
MKRVLIANRGEIAVRIIRACRDLGLETVAVYSTADKDALHVLLADQAVCIGPGPAPESYINIPRILSAIEISGADAVHPGYGFLSENADFARQCEKGGITFIGPSSEAIDRLGNKVEAKKIATEAKAPVVPGRIEAFFEPNEALEESRNIGYPVVLKARSGGGGKGIHILFDEHHFSEKFYQAQQEAKKSFGDDALYVEKFIQNPRHIEVQILADHHGNVLHLFERDCTTQRRRQKLIEEAPSPVLTPQERNYVTQAAVRLCKKAGYNSVGTVEFLFDQTRTFYFMEVNTRIQVEHCVTEELTGIDLIKEQIKVACGQKLSLIQDDIEMRGNVIEFRINAEDPKKNFLPSPGKMELFQPPLGPNIRMDTHSFAGYTIPPYYDSMIAKLIVKGKNREEALLVAKRALREFFVAPNKTTIPFHQFLIENEEFVENRLTINTIDRWIEEGLLREQEPALL